MLSIVSSQKLDWTHTFDTHCIYPITMTTTLPATNNQMPQSTKEPIRYIYRVYQKKLNKPEIVLRLCKAPQCTKFFIEI